MSCFTGEDEVRAVIGGFLARFPRLDPILREALGHERMVMKLELTGPGFAAEIDAGITPLAVRFDATGEGMIALAGPAENFHHLLLGRLPLAVAINQKKLLVRGPASKLMKSAPLFYLAPYLYPFYLESIGRSDLVLVGGRPLLHAPRTKEEPMNRIVNKLAWLIGFALGTIKKRFAPRLDVVSALESLGQGLARAYGEKTTAR
jgi:hypothetical protein